MRNNEFHSIFAPLIDQEVRYHRSWDDGCLAIGLGDYTEEHTIRSKLFYSEWEIRTYESSWRILKGSDVLIAGNDDYEVIYDYMKNSDPRDWGSLSSVTQLSEFDHRFCFSSGIYLDFLATVNHRDKAILVFYPDEPTYFFDVKYGWKIEKMRS